MKPLNVRSVGYGAWLALLALQPFNQFGALRQIGGLVLLVCLLTLGWRAFKAGNCTLPRPDWCVGLGLALVAWAVAVSLLGPYPLDSAHELRKALLVQLMMVAGGLVFIRGNADLRRAIGWALGGFALVSLLSAGEVLAYWWAHGPVLEIPRSHDDWWGGYGPVGACLAVLLAGWLLLPGLARPWRVGGGLLLLLAAALVFLYWARTPLVVMLLGIGLLLLLGRRWRWLGGAAAMAVLGVAVLAALPGERFARYQSLLKSQTYVSNSGLSLRPALWSGMLEVIEQRPLTGYGYGWKKLAWAINDGGFAARWQADEKKAKAAYFLAGADQASYGRVNPHNYFLQVAFEIGWLGLALALAFWAALIKGCADQLRSGLPAERRALAAAVLALVGAYWLSNFTNGQWVGGLVNITLALSAGLLALARERSQG